MSAGERKSLETARKYAEQLVKLLQPGCARIEIAGSIRRARPLVGDIELVCIPKMETMPVRMFPDELVSALEPLLQKLKGKQGWKAVRNGPSFKQFALGARFGGMTLDLFITTPEKWAVIFLLRTGNAAFSHWLVTHKRHGGALPGFLQIKDGRVWEIGSYIHSPCATPEEADVFRLLGLDFIPPEERQR
jgi:DNA polymerase/3'-5' exonuclease PolX